MARSTASTTVKPGQRKPPAPRARLADPRANAAREDGVQDGRRNRTVATRKRIVAAMIELVRNGVLAPTAEQVSASAAVGLRTVFRHFDDMETLYREMAHEVDSMVLPLLRAPSDAASWQERLLESIAARNEIFERISPFYIGTQAHRHQSQFLDENLRRMATFHHEWLCGMLPRPLAQYQGRLAALELLLSVDAWIRLRREQGLTAAVATKVMQDATRYLIGGQVE